jgi:hypothetical protein
MWKDDLRDEDQDVFKQLGDAKERNFPNANMLFQQMRAKYLPTALHGRFANNCGCEGCGTLFCADKKVKRRDGLVTETVHQSITDDDKKRYKDNYFMARLLQNVTLSDRTRFMEKSRQGPSRDIRDFYRLCGYSAMKKDPTVINNTIEELLKLTCNYVLPRSWYEFTAVKSHVSLLCDKCFCMYGDTERMSHIKRFRLPLAEEQVGQVDIGHWRSMAGASDAKLPVPKERLSPRKKARV